MASEEQKQKNDDTTKDKNEKITEKVKDKNNQNRMCLGGRFTPAEIQKVKLSKTKKTKAQKQKEKTKFAKQLCETSDDYYKLVKETYFENYYESIKDLTFPTSYINLTKNEAKILMELYKKYESTKDKNKFKYNNDIINKLCNEIDKIKKENKWKYIFIRMSIRSPKDAALESKKFIDIINKEYKSLQKFNGKNPPNDLKINGKLKGINREKIWDTNLKIIACYRGQTFALSCKDGLEAMDLLIKSKRIQGDMESYIKGEYEQKFQLCIRKFQYFDVCFEFRSFIYKKNITGITQYNDLCYFSDLVKFKDKIGDKIIKFINNIMKRIKLNSFVLDIVMVDDNDNNHDNIWKPLTLQKIGKLKIMIIEINPLAEFAGGGLFEWNTDKDVLLDEKGKCQFRIQTELHSHVSASLMDEWKPFIYGDSINNDDKKNADKEDESKEADK